MVHNMKKELQTLGKALFELIKILERLSEIEYQNRLLLKKMLQLDTKAKSNAVPVEKPPINPSALNQYNSLNRKIRIKDLSRIVEDNKEILKRLQSTKSCY